MESLLSTGLLRLVFTAEATPAALQSLGLTFLACIFLSDILNVFLIYEIIKSFPLQLCLLPYFSLNCDSASSFHFPAIGSSLDPTDEPSPCFQTHSPLERKVLSRNLSLIMALSTASPQQLNPS